MNSHFKIAIVEPSTIIRCGLETLLKSLPNIRFQFVELPINASLLDNLRLYRPDILIINPSLPGCVILQNIKEECGCPKMKCIALLYAVADNTLLRSYDEQISIYDNCETIKGKIDRINYHGVSSPKKVSEDEQQLSAREKEILTFVVKGLTNRKIAAILFLSTHTVVTHRRNITRKLQIHSVSGLTVYAIVNNLVELEDIQKPL